MRPRLCRKSVGVKVALGQHEDEVSSMSDEANAGLEQALLEARHVERQDQPTHEMAEVVGDHAEQQAHRAVEGEIR